LVRFGAEAETHKNRVKPHHQAGPSNPTIPERVRGPGSERIVCQKECHNKPMHTKITGGLAHLSSQDATPLQLTLDIERFGHSRQLQAGAEPGAIHQSSRYRLLRLLDMKFDCDTDT